MTNGGEKDVCFASIIVGLALSASSKAFLSTLLELLLLLVLLAEILFCCFFLLFLPSLGGSFVGPIASSRGSGCLIASSTVEVSNYTTVKHMKHYRRAYYVEWIALL